MNESGHENKCPACKEPFDWSEDVVLVNDDLYHVHCVDLYPTGFVAFLDGEFLGETENEDGSSAYEYLPDLLKSDADE